ncbi:MAG: LysR family transcriptional regulator [Erysipelotrichaceae bacterium]
MTFRHLRILIKVCETGSTTKAAKQLFISQPSVSLAISELEKYYGIQIFNRISKRFYLTEVGKNFLNYATHIIELYDQMENEFKNSDQIGLFRIGSSVTIGNHLLPTYLAQLKEKHPEVEFKVFINNSTTIEKYVLENIVDIALIEGVVHNEQLIRHEFKKDELEFICSPKHPFANKKMKLSQLQNEQILLREKGSAARDIFDAVMMRENIKIDPSWESVSNPAILNAVSLNLGISILPSFLIKEDIINHKITTFEVSNLDLTRSFSIIYHKNKFIAGSMKEFIEICKDEKCG